MARQNLRSIGCRRENDQLAPVCVWTSNFQSGSTSEVRNNHTSNRDNATKAFDFELGVQFKNVCQVGVTYSVSSTINLAKYNY